MIPRNLLEVAVSHVTPVFTDLVRVETFGSYSCRGVIGQGAAQS